MPRKRVTQIFPWLLPLRMKQRLFFFYTGMRLDGNQYAEVKSETPLPYQLFETSCPLYNRETGFDMVYQENKVFNLKLAAATLDRVVIRPNETFSFWKLVRYANRDIPYKDGLTVIDRKLTTAPGGGMCQMSNLLFWMFLHAPLTVMERHGHDVKDFPEPPSDAPMGVDATVSEGWLDLKVRNDTEASFQISIAFDEDRIIGRLLTDQDTRQFYEVVNGEPLYYRKNDKVYEEVDVNQKTILAATGACTSKKLLYRNKCEIGYSLPEGTEVMGKGSKEK
ncbi:hypothetical protein OBV_09520 [Oscillibacter valericigenes Sjm18-20]|nr:hypothetical protein OBV_09520 [Oscillibacter valericigenes Sjm18-20]